MKISISYRKVIFHIIDENKELVWIFLHFSMYRGIFPGFNLLEDEKQLKEVFSSSENSKYVRMPARIHITDHLRLLKLCEMQKNGTLSVRYSRDVIRNQLNIYDGDFFAKIGPS